MVKKSKNKIIVRIKGGIGNQLFCYAAARRLSLVNKYHLVIDHVTGFLRDYKYHRQYALNHFNIPCRYATPFERMQPFDRYRRYIGRYIAQKRPFDKRRYVEQDGRPDFDGRLLSLKPRHNIYLDGYWQSEDYFKDIEETIRTDLKFCPPKDMTNQRMAKEIQKCESVAIHVRWFDAPKTNSIYNITDSYYRDAMNYIRGKIRSPHYFIFSDDPDAARELLGMSGKNVTYVMHNCDEKTGFADLWLMSLCRHFIIANSTFSWWGAWLSASKDKIIICPSIKITHPKGTMRWNIRKQIPEAWIQI